MPSRTWAESAARWVRRPNLAVCLLKVMMAGWVICWGASSVAVFQVRPHLGQTQRSPYAGEASRRSTTFSYAFGAVSFMNASVSA